MAESNSFLEVFSRTLLIILNVIIVLSGLGLIAVQSWAVSIHESQESDSNEKTILIVFLVISLFIEFVAVLGIVSGVMSHKPAVLNTYIFCMVVMLLCTLILGIILLVKGNVSTEVSEDFYKNQFIRQMKLYAQNAASKFFVDKFQEGYDCCGSESYSDWKEQVKKKPPKSCCREDDCNTNVPAKLFDEGCAEDYKNFMQTVLQSLGYYGLGMAIAQFICVVCAIVIAIKERRSIQGNFLLLQPTNDLNLSEYEVKNI